MAYKIILNWKEQAIKCVAKGKTLDEAAILVRVSKGRLLNEINRDEDFKTRIQEAKRNSPKSLQW